MKVKFWLLHAYDLLAQHGCCDCEDYYLMDPSAEGLEREYQPVVMDEDGVAGIWNLNAGIREAGDRSHEVRYLREAFSVLLRLKTRVLESGETIDDSKPTVIAV